MANIAQTVNVLQALILTEGEKMVTTPTYHVFEMYKDHQDATLLPIKLTCSSYRHGKKAIPAVSASCSRGDGGTIHLTLCNLDPAREINLRAQSAE
jgi:alpha-N-arabinofuranosidase